MLEPTSNSILEIVKVLGERYQKWIYVQDHVTGFQDRDVSVNKVF